MERLSKDVAECIRLRVVIEFTYTIRKYNPSNSGPRKSRFNGEGYDE